MANFISLFFCKKRKKRRFQREFESLEQMASDDLTPLPFPGSSVAPSLGFFAVQHRQIRFQSPCDFIARPPAEPNISSCVACTVPRYDWGIDSQAQPLTFQ
jgi:hypothetical protein